MYNGHQAISHDLATANPLYAAGSLESLPKNAAKKVTEIYGGRSIKNASGTDIAATERSSAYGANEMTTLAQRNNTVILSDPVTLVESGRRQLENAIRSENFEAVQDCLNAGISPDCLINGRSLLSYYAKENKIEPFSQLLAYFQPVCASNKVIAESLIIAVSTGCCEMVQQLIDAGLNLADPRFAPLENPVDKKKTCLVDLACREYQLVMAQFLIENGYPIDTVNLDFHCFIFWADCRGIEFCLRNGIGIDINKPFMECSPIINLIYRHFGESSIIPALRVLVNHGADIKNTLLWGKRRDLLCAYFCLEEQRASGARGLRPIQTNARFPLVRELALVGAGLSKAVKDQLKTFNRGELDDIAARLGVSTALPKAVMLKKIFIEINILSSTKDFTLENLTIRTIASNLNRHCDPEREIQMLGLSKPLVNRIREVMTVPI